MKANIILLHGALGYQDQLISLKGLLSHRLNVHSLNFSGHGGRLTSNNFSMQLFTQDVMNHLQESKIDKTHVFGYSMGGYVGLNVAKNHPSYVDKIITLGTKFNWTQEAAEKEVQMLNPDKIQEKVPAFAHKLAAIHGENNWKHVVRSTASLMLDLGSGGKLSNEDLSLITQNVLIGIGSKDDMVSIEESKSVATALPNGHLKIIENLVHPIDKIDFNVLSKIILEFTDE